MEFDININEFNQRKKRQKNIINKKHYKKVEGKCRICSENNYVLLDVHRIKPGRDGGKYNPKNVVTLCANCHRKVDTGEFEIIGWVSATGGDLLHIIRNNKDEYL